MHLYGYDNWHVVGFLWGFVWVDAEDFDEFTGGWCLLVLGQRVKSLEKGTGWAIWWMEWCKCLLRYSVRMCLIYPIPSWPSSYVESANSANLQLFLTRACNNRILTWNAPYRHSQEIWEEFGLLRYALFLFDTSNLTFRTRSQIREMLKDPFWSKGTRL